jgi:ribosomal protein S18 acetylase RimI-like enzyme
MELRPVSADDLGFLVAMTLLAAFPPGGIPEAAAEMPHVTRWVEEWGRPTDVGVVAWHDGDSPGEAWRVGAAWCRVQDNVLARDAEGRALPELAIAVAPDHQARGVGRLMLDGIAQAASAAGHHSLSLQVNAHNPALRLYERVGFEVVGRDGDRLTMVKSLGSNRG